jgi:hypothetical protein
MARANRHVVLRRGGSRSVVARRDRVRSANDLPRMQNQAATRAPLSDLDIVSQAIGINK